jgi:hypothetical protein
MRKQLFAVLAFFCVFPIFSSAQDPAAQAAQQAAQNAMQQAMQQAQAATAEAIRQAQDAAQQSAQLNQQAAMNAANAPYLIPTAATPSISKKSGSYNSSFIVRLKSSTRGAAIYYTTDGWTPTVDSLRYTGPISIDSSTKLQAIAVAPNLQRSLVASAQFTFPMPPASATAAAPLPTPAQDPSGKYIFPCDTPVHLVFSEDVNEKKAEVGNKVPMILAEDFAAGDMIFAKKGTPVDAVVSESDGPHHGGIPGILAFKAQSFQTGGVTVFLRGWATREGQAKPPNASILIPVVGPFLAFRHGTSADIKKGTAFTAYLAQDTLLAPLN